jgi:deoxyribonuclease V
MIVALDVQYNQTQSDATAAAVVFAQWTDAVPTADYSCVIENVQPYVPGEFFRRELPCLLAVLGKINEPVTTIVIDGYVRLNDRPGLGQHLFEHLNQSTPVIGVAKTPFHGASPVEVFRGSKSPLFVSAMGIDLQEAAIHIKAMHGPYRMPRLLKRVDLLARGR